MARTRPLIGVNCQYQSDIRYPVRDQIGLYTPYYQALLSAGALPVVVPIVENPAALTEYLNRVDALMFTGGEDIPPQAYGQEKHPRTQECHPRRFANDRLLAELVLQREIPVLAICMGLQLVNVVYGGTLIQDIQTDIQHTPIDPGNDSYHSIVIEEENLLHQIVGATEIEVNSAHHQAVEKLAPGLAGAGPRSRRHRRGCADDGQGVLSRCAMAPRANCGEARTAKVVRGLCERLPVWLLVRA